MIRVFEDEQLFGDPYRYVFAYHHTAEDTIELVGMCVRAPTPDEARAMLRACHERGWKITRQRYTGLRCGLRDITRTF